MSKIPPQRISALFHVFKLFNSNHVIYNFIIYNLQISLFGAKVRKIPLPLFLSLKCCHNINKLLKLSCLSLFLALVMADYSAFILGGLPKQGQTLEEVKDLLLNEIKKLRAGESDEKMLQTNINNFKLYELQSMESNEGRADIFVNSFINGTNWEDEVTAIDRMAKLTKEDISAEA